MVRMSRGVALSNVERRKLGTGRARKRGEMEEGGGQDEGRNTRRIEGGQLKEEEGNNG